MLCPSPEDLPDPGIELASLTSPALIDGFPGNSAGKKDPPAMQETLVRFLGWEDAWRRERLPTPVFWTGEFHGLYNPWGRKESDTTE